MLDKSNIEIGKVVKIDSRPDIGLVSIKEIIKFESLICIRTSKGGIFDQYDITEASKDEIDLFAKNGKDYAHSLKDWTKIREKRSVDEFKSEDGIQSMRVEALKSEV